MNNVSRDVKQDYVSGVTQDVYGNHMYASYPTTGRTQGTCQK